MITIYSLWKYGVCYGRFTQLKHAKEVQSAYEEEGLETELSTDFAYTKLYEVKEKIERVKETRTRNKNEK